MFPPEGHPSSDEDIEMEVPDDDDEEMAPMSSEPHEKPHQPEAEEPIFYPREEFNKYNYVGQHTNPNRTMKEYNHMLDSFGGASFSVIAQPGDEAVCKGTQGQKWGNPIPCNGGGWVNIDHILSREDAFPQDRYKKNDRFQIIAKCIRSEDRKAPKPRLQIFAAKFDQEIDMETMTSLKAAGWSKNDIDWVRREHGGWWQPWCMRASGHSVFGFARPAELCNILFPNMSDRLGGAFHVTKPSALEGIILRCIVPGGSDSARRLAVHFGVFAPWDSENISTKTAMHDIKGGDDLIAICPGFKDADPSELWYLVETSTVSWTMKTLRMLTS